MLRSLEVSNYKCFNNVVRLDLSPGWNIVVGKNNSGKTSLVSTFSVFSVPNTPYRGISTPRDLSGGPNSQVRAVIELDGRVLLSVIAKNKAVLKGHFLRSNYASHQSVSEKFTNLFESGTIVAEFTQLAASSRQDGFVTDGEGTPLNTGDAAATLECKPPYNSITCDPTLRAGSNTTWQDQVFSYYRDNCYIFKAERLQIGRCAIADSTVLAPNAENLAQVLNKLRENKKRFERYVQTVSEVFPEITDIILTTVGSSEVEVKLSSVPISEEREDLAIPLSQSGTGVSQALAILYVVITSNSPKTIVIDEPSSFLHPGAAKQLMRILKRYRMHQFVISTHSTELIEEIGTASIFLVRWTSHGSTVEKLSRTNVEHAKDILAELGTRLSDVFGPDKIIYVEGPTEVECFKRILEHKGFELGRGVQILPLLHTDTITSRGKNEQFRIYEQVASSISLVPPAIAYCRDRELLSDQKMRDLKKESGGRMLFIKRRSIENYFVQVDALLAYLTENGFEPTRSEIADWIKVNGGTSKYMKNTGWKGEVGDVTWRDKVDASKLLHDLVSFLSDNKIEYHKISVGLWITDWLLSNRPDEMDELVEFITALPDVQPINVAS